MKKYKSDVLAALHDDDYERQVTEYFDALTDRLGPAAFALWAYPLRLDDMWEAGKRERVAWVLFDKLDAEEKR